VIGCHHGFMRSRVELLRCLARFDLDVKGMRERGTIQVCHRRYMVSRLGVVIEVLR